MTNDTPKVVTDLPEKKRRIPRPNRNTVMKYGAAAAAGAAAVFVFVPRRAKVDVSLQETEDTNES